LHEVDVVGNIKSHLRSGSRGSIIKFNKSIIKLSGHSQDHVIEVRVEVFSLGNIHSFGGFVVITGQNVVNVVDTTGSFVDFRKISGPNSSVGVFSFILRKVGRVDSVMDVSISVFPFLVVVLFEMVVGRVD